MKVTWTVTSVGYQRIAKRCPSCKIKRDFTPSGAFRVNSQKKVLDVWSIYKCTHCDYTWNISLFSRLNVSKINRQLYHRLMTNDAATVQHFASDIAILKRNNAELSGRPDFTVQERWPVSITAHQRVRVRVRIPRSFQVSLLSILKQQLMLSAGEIQRRVEAGQIAGVTMKLLKSRKLKAAEYEFQLSAEMLFARRRIALCPG
ncbi:DUF1062 domain-containing protein [Citrobacter freundii]|uniref:DUF1062 domain-containing protein n=1 Tax=Citrobacter freundii TaxID=546 RepID=UPI0019034054|nr:DUF1062 domain-containing protein [Citrobacter freundii]ELP2756776.1 DUF1062 domain-containing protein [Klebsiella oxytoca]EMA4453319.1 DUF1062 domain-containing protein [Citrobacter freundii]MBJ9307789.1 DUF1062 domain-containing protein [Citrobacter freundii]HEC2163585.1 DUF1062 domain-containing protein [Klebsiella oxytoca]HEJ7339305.1 DUF1062 domain-containing protein [Klebsiella oxytoca]